MRLKSLTCVCAALTVLGLAAAPAGASIMRSGTKAKIPFEFVVAGKTMPAGNYTFDVNANQHLVSIRGENGDAAITFVDRVDVYSDDLLKPRLTFEKKGGKYVLKQVRPVK